MTAVGGVCKVRGAGGGVGWWVGGWLGLSMDQ